MTLGFLVSSVIARGGKSGSSDSGGGGAVLDPITKENTLTNKDFAKWDP